MSRNKSLWCGVFRDTHFSGQISLIWVWCFAGRHHRSFRVQEMECSGDKKIGYHLWTMGLEVEQGRERNQEKKVDSLKGRWKGQGFDEVNREASRKKG